MSEYISREAAIALTDQHCFESGYDAEWMETELRDLPSADVRPVVRGKWIEYTRVVVPEPYNKWEQAWKCDKCGFDDGFPAYNFCPNCGADMREKDDHD